jgi:hypothetical protein
VIPLRIQLLSGGIATATTDSFVENAIEFRTLTPFKFIDRGSAQFSSRINPGDPAMLGMSGIPANVVFAEIKSNSASLYVSDGKKARILGKVRPYRGDGSAASVLEWTLQSLGYDGVIISVKGTYVLAAGSSKMLQGEKIQALAIRSSEKSIALLTRKRSGSGLLQLEKAKNGYAIFRILAKAKDTSALLPGTKLTVQKTAAAGPN